MIAVTRSGALTQIFTGPDRVVATSVLELEGSRFK
jgi:hypothetical protein